LARDFSVIISDLSGAELDRIQNGASIIMNSSK
jgi:hypothetical protein